MAISVAYGETLKRNVFIFVYKVHKRTHRKKKEAKECQFSIPARHVISPSPGPLTHYPISIIKILFVVIT